MELVMQSLISGIVVGSIYALVALGFVLIYKSTAVINFAQGELLMFGAYLCLTLVVAFKIPFWFAFFVTLLAAAMLGLLLERLFLRPMIGEPAISIIMLTIGLASLLQGMIHVTWGSETMVYPTIFPTEPLKFGKIVVSQVYLYSVFFAVICLILFNLFFRYSRSGIAMRAVANDQQAAQSMGISIKRIVRHRLGHRRGRRRRGRHSDREYQWRQYQLERIRAQGLSGGHPGRSGQHPRRHPGRFYHRNSRGAQRYLPRSPLRRGIQGSRALLWFWSSF